jgi:hypothetical protein
MDDVKNGQVDGILCWHNDRLHRHQRELEDFIELVDQSAIPVQTGHRRHLQFVGRERQDDRSYPWRCGPPRIRAQGGKTEG